MYGWEFLAVCHHPDKFGYHRHRESEDMFLICHVTSRLKGYVILWVEATHGKSPPFHEVDGYWSCASGDMKTLICHMTSQNHMIEG